MRRSSARRPCSEVFTDFLQPPNDELLSAALNNGEVSESAVVKEIFAGLTTRKALQRKPFESAQKPICSSSELRAIWSRLQCWKSRQLSHRKAALQPKCLQTPLAAKSREERCAAADRSRSGRTAGASSGFTEFHWVSPSGSNCFRFDWIENDWNGAPKIQI